MFFLSEQVLNYVVQILWTSLLGVLLSCICCWSLVLPNSKDGTEERMSSVSEDTFYAAIDAVDIEKGVKKEIQEHDVLSELDNTSEEKSSFEFEFQERVQEENDEDTIRYVFVDWDNVYFSVKYNQANLRNLLETRITPEFYKFDYENLTRKWCGLSLDSEELKESPEKQFSKLFVSYYSSPIESVCPFKKVQIPGCSKWTIKEQTDVSDIYLQGHMSEELNDIMLKYPFLSKGAQDIDARSLSREKKIIISLVTGDGNDSSNNESTKGKSFVNIVERFLRAGCYVELHSWKNSMSRNYIRLKAKKEFHQNRFSIHFMDENKEIAKLLCSPRIQKFHDEIEDLKSINFVKHIMLVSTISEQNMDNVKKLSVPMNALDDIYYLETMIDKSLISGASNVDLEILRQYMKRIEHWNHCADNIKETLITVCGKFLSENVPNFVFKKILVEVIDDRLNRLRNLIETQLCSEYRSEYISVYSM